MIRPSFPSRLAGKPVMALLICASCAYVVWNWYQGDVVWWQAVIAAGIAKRTLSAVGELRRYKAWEAEWSAMGAPLGGDAAPPRKASRNAKIAVIGTVLILAYLFLPDALYKPVENVLLPTAWLSFLFLLFLPCRAIVRRVRRGRMARVEAIRAAEEDAPVAWVMDGARSSPSRMEAANNLPEYSGRLLS